MRQRTGQPWNQQPLKPQPGNGHPQVQIIITLGNNGAAVMKVTGGQLTPASTIAVLSQLTTHLAGQIIQHDSMLIVPGKTQGEIAGGAVDDQAGPDRSRPAIEAADHAS